MRDTKNTFRGLARGLLTRVTGNDFLEDALADISRYEIAREVLSPILRESILRPYISRKIIFIHIPRTGGTALSCYLYGDMHRGRHLSATCISRYLPYEFSGLPKIAVLRDPVSRMKSSVGLIKSGGTEQLSIHPSTLTKTRKLKSLSDFISYVEDNIENPSGLDFCFRTQSSFVCDDKKQPMMDFLYRYEDGLDVLIRESILKSKEELPRLNITPKKFRDEICSDRDVERILILYKEDVELYRSIPVSSPIKQTVDS